MIVDTSALMAISKREVDYVQLRDAIFDEPGFLPAPVYVEFRRVVTRSPKLREQEALAIVGEFLAGPLVWLPFSAEHAEQAALANQRFGIGVRTGGTLNLLDLMVYACAKVERRPILCTGRDFAATDALIHPASRTTA